MQMGIRYWAALLSLSAGAIAADSPRYTESGDLLRPENYREWIYLTSGLGMTYGPAAQLSPNPMFDNVFVEPSAYRSFRETGKWPDKTVLVLEIRHSESHGSINKAGHFQTGIRAVEVAVKDEQRFPDKWAYFGFEASNGIAPPTGKLFGKNAGCNACHGANGAVENTFVQFYPTLLEIARKKGTLKASFQMTASDPLNH
jgi:hypothetical protein